MIGWIRVITSIAAGTTLFCSAVTAEVEQFRGKVVEIVISEGNYGDCMARLDSVSYSAASCDNWVTFSCSGRFNSKSVGNNKLQNAQMSLVANRVVRGLVDDTKKHNGKCFATDFNVLVFQ